MSHNLAMQNKPLAQFTLPLLILASTLAGCAAMDGKRTLEFSAQQIQDAIASKFPQERCPLPLTCIQLQNPKVVLAEASDRITMGFDTRVSILQQSVTGSALVSAKPRFQASTGEVYLDDSRIEGLNFKGVPTRVTDLLSQYGAGLVKQSLDRTPIYTLNTAQADKLGKLGIADVRVANGKLRIALDPAQRQALKVAP